MGTKSDKRRIEIYAILGLIISLCGVCGTWLAVPKIQPILDRWIGKTAPPIPAPVATETPSNTAITTYTVTILNDATKYLRFDNTFEIAPEQMTFFDIVTGLHKITIEFSYNGETWMLDTSLELDLNKDITFDCKDRPYLEWTFKSIGASFGFYKHDDASYIECAEKK
jgi:hypothetical protein